MLHAILLGNQALYIPNKGALSVTSRQVVEEDSSQTWDLNLLAGLQRAGWNISQTVHARVVNYKRTLIVWAVV